MLFDEQLMHRVHNREEVYSFTELVSPAGVYIDLHDGGISSYSARMDFSSAQ
jgi:hypothetical protein